MCSNHSKFNQKLSMLIIQKRNWCWFSKKRTSVFDVYDCASCMLKFIVICIECGHWRIRSYFLTRKRFVICSILLVIRKCIRISPKNRFLVCSIPRTHRSKQQSDETAQTLFPFTIRILIVVGCNVGLGGHVNCVVAPTTIWWSHFTIDEVGDITRGWLLNRQRVLVEPIGNF